MLIRSRKGRARVRRKWPAALKQVFEENPHGLRYSEIKRKLGIPDWSLNTYLRRWTEQKQIEKNVITGLWKASTGTVVLVPTGTHTTVRQRAEITGLSRSQQGRLDQIARDRRDLLKLIAEGELSIGAAFEAYQVGRYLAEIGSDSQKS